ncbi:hypothetical protein HY945_05710 [Candidatus Gottesmanbacteria bacterium]|nr:hypothetical protein [Candidatus Gottesmanbacteria bacterium]
MTIEKKIPPELLVRDANGMVIGHRPAGDCSPSGQSDVDRVLTASRPPHIVEALARGRSQSSSPTETSVGGSVPTLVRRGRRNIITVSCPRGLV